MSKVPQRDEIWKHRETGYLVRVISNQYNYVSFYDNEDGCDSIDIMGNGTSLKFFMEDYVFIGNGKPLDVLFEVCDDD